MRRAVIALVVVALALTACSPTPTPSPNVLRIDVVNRSRSWVVVSVGTDAAGAMPGFLPGQSGTIMIPLGDPANGVSVEVLGPPSCQALATGSFPSTQPFTLLLDDPPGLQGVVLTSRLGVAQSAIPVPKDTLHCPAG